VDAVNDAYDTAATAYSVDRSGVTPNLHIWYSNASEAMRVTSAGNVGIGTSTPATALDVNGTVTADGLTVDVAGTADIVFQRDNAVSGKLELDFASAFANFNSVNDGLTFSQNAVKALQIRGGDISFYEDLGVTAQMVWDASADALTFGDNVKAIFGAGSDLQIFHSGSHSIITDTGTGDLKILGQNVEIGATSGELNFKSIAGAQAQIYYNNALKLATTATGIDVTGTVTADGLTVDGAAVFNESGADVDFRIESDTNANAFFLQGSDGRIGIGTGSPLQSLHVNSSGNTQLLISSSFNNSTITGLSVDTVGDSSVCRISASKSGATQGVLSFLHNSSSALQAWNLAISGSDVYRAGYSEHIWKTNNTERLRITSTGSVGIGTSSPSQALDVVGSIEVSGGIYLGGTAAANLLDDYEEGTWTPAYQPQTGALGSITYSIQAGNYTKVGRQVTVTGRITTTGSVTIGTASSSMRISGLPFTVGNGEAFYSAATLTYIESWTTGDAPSSAYVATNSNLMVLRIRNAGSDGPENNMTPSEFVAGADGGCSLMFSATYFTA
jgi:hypothetical protein